MGLFKKQLILFYLFSGFMFMAISSLQFEPKVLLSYFTMVVSTISNMLMQSIAILPIFDLIFSFEWFN